MAIIDWSRELAFALFRKHKGERAAADGAATPDEGAKAARKSGSIWTWITPFPALARQSRDLADLAARGGAFIGSRAQVISAFFKSVDMKKFGALRVRAFRWPGQVGYLLCAASVFFAWGGEIVVAIVFLATLLSLCFLGG